MFRSKYYNQLRFSVIHLSNTFIQILKSKRSLVVYGTPYFLPTAIVGK